MELLVLFLVALGLCFDTFAVSVSSGIARTSISFWQASLVAFTLAFFQALMPLLGWFIGQEIISLVREADHWIAFGLLGLLGLKMIVEGSKASGKPGSFNPLEWRILLMLSLATSIDALVVGISFGTLDVNILLACSIIGGMTYLVAMLGILFGKMTGSKIGKRMEIAGGIILILIGTKILLEHTWLAN